MVHYFSDSAIADAIYKSGKKKMSALHRKEFYGGRVLDVGPMEFALSHEEFSALCGCPLTSINARVRPLKS